MFLGFWVVGLGVKGLELFGLRGCGVRVLGFSGAAIFLGLLS